MKILHIASFNGNIGDNANHNGFKENFTKLMDKEINWDFLEMRKFYKIWNIYHFDSSFVKKANKYDLIIIGGGNFFDLCHKYSSNGTTIDITIDILNQIETPIFFNALGFDIHNGYDDKMKKDFFYFIKYLSENQNKYFISFRNDGSKKNFEILYGKILKEISIIPDGGFFLKINKNKNKNKYLGINVACDMLDKRLINISYNELCKKLGKIYFNFIQNYPEYKLIFFPHIFSDYKIIFDILSNMNDYFIKYYVEIAPYLTGQGSENDFFSYYKKCDVITGTRFHSNVCSIALNIPVVPIINYPQISNLYEEIGYKEKIIYLDEENFEEKYYKELINGIKDTRETKLKYKKIKKELNKNLELEYKKLQNWIKNNKKGGHSN
ncbi:polysaccharide pyruvyl transferase family protein [Fusobacterium sp. THCT1E2]